MDPSSLSVWLEFLVCLALIVAAGVQLTRYGDAIADRTRLGGTWVGLIMLATVTSLPELAAGVSAVTAAMVPDIAAGDVLGSCVYNLLLVAVVDYLKRGAPIYSVARREHVLPASFSILLLGFVGLSLVLAGSGRAPSLGAVGAYSPVIVVLYLVAMHTVYRFERQVVERFVEKEPDRYPQLSLRAAILRYALASCVVVAAGIWLPFVSARLALEMGWYQSFVGTLFTALVTSLPELVVTIAAMRIGALDMALGDILGSNLFDVLILAIDDFFYAPGPLLSAVSPVHLVTVLSAIMMTGTVAVALYVRPKSRFRSTAGWASVLLFVLFLINSYVLYGDSHPR